MQGGPTRFVDICIKRNQALTHLAHSSQRRQHQGALITRVALLHPNTRRIKQHRDYFGRRLFNRQQQAVQARRARRVHIKAARNELADPLGIV